MPPISLSLIIRFLTPQVNGGTHLPYCVLVTKYANYAYQADKSGSIVSPERPRGLASGDRFDASTGVETVASKCFFHMPLYRSSPNITTLCGRDDPGPLDAEHMWRLIGLRWHLLYDPGNNDRSPHQLPCQNWHRKSRVPNRIDLALLFCRDSVR